MRTTSGIVLMLLLLVVIFAQIGDQTAGSTVAHTVTAYGNAQIDTAQSKFGGASGLFDGTGDYLSTPDSADWYFGTGDFTIDFWVRFNALPGYNGLSMFYSQGANGDDRNVVYWGLINQAGTYTWGLQVYNNIQLRWTTSPTVTTNTWYHVALVRNDNSWICFQDGTSLGTQTNSNTVPDFAAPLYVGVYSNGQSSCFLNGWVDEFRVSKGVARWTSNFTPSTSAYTGDSNTVLLLHMDGADGSTAFIDDSVVTGPDFLISASPTSQSIGAGSTASFTLSLSASGGFSETVSLSVTSGCPSGVTCTVAPDSISSFPNTATLSVPTLITTTGTYSVVVTASSTSNTHTATATVNVAGPASYSFNVKASATQIVVTLTYSWAGSGAPPSGTITVAGPGGTPTLGESGAVVYDRTSIAVSGGANTYALIHRVTFTMTAPGSAQVWTAYVSLSGVSSYNLTIEVS